MFDHFRDLVKVMVGQRLFDGIVTRVAGPIAASAHSILLSAIALTAGASELPESPRFVDSRLT